MVEMKNSFRILSIDFDFFPDVTKKQLQNYPDGIDLPTEISTIVWQSRYKMKNSGISEISINKFFYKQVLDILAKQTDNIPVMIANSHVHAYDFIANNYDNQTIELFNIDLHHDLINDNQELDCGNWIKHLIKDYPVKDFHWIARETSKVCYDIKEQEQKLLHMEFDFESIKNVEFDAVFLCRSDSWLPPHLDGYFDYMVKSCCTIFKNVTAENSILRPRNIAQINHVLSA